MSPNAFSENDLVEAAAMDALESLAWTTLSAEEETFGQDGSLGRLTTKEVVLAPRLKDALARLNPGIPPAALAAAFDQLSQDRAAMGAAVANREVHGLLTDGVKLTFRNPETGLDEPRTLRVVDWDRPDSNDFLAVRQITFKGPLYNCRPDIVLFVNGLPFVVIELKRTGVAARQAFDDNLTSYKHPQNGVPALFAYNAFLMASNGSESRVGSLTADWDRFFEWKRIESEKEERRVSLDCVLRGTCDPTRLLDIVRNFTLFSELESGLVKILAQNHQYLGVNNAIAKLLGARAAGSGQAGVFWQTQGSGKSFSMVFFSQKILRTVPGNWTFVVVTDRIELDDQIAKTFAACGAVRDATACHAASREHLKALLRGNERYVFTLIHKFDGAEVLNDRRDIVVIADEAHRSQYDTLAMAMRSALPNAMFAAFTGTPLLAGEEKTKDVFGDYVSIYDFNESVADGATVPLYYENRTPELNLTNPNLSDDIYEIIDQAGLAEEDEAKLQRLLGQKYHLLTVDSRLDTVAKDIVHHFLGRGFQGKAMVVSIDKATALRTHDKVRAEWAAETARVKVRLGDYSLEGADRLELEARLRRLETVDMALIVSPGQNEIEDMRKLGLDIVPHRKRMNDEDLADHFKKPGDPLSLVFVCAMWLTGFDAPSCSTIYLDKPMRNHTLMQTIARANRVYPGKQSGVIVDYADVFDALVASMKLYGNAPGAGLPAQSKDTLVGELRKALGEIEAFCRAAGVELAALEAPQAPMARLKLLVEATDKLVAPDDRRKAFRALERLAVGLYQALKPHRTAFEFAVRMSTVIALDQKILEATTRGGKDLGEVLREIGKVLDSSIEGSDMVKDGPAAVNLAQIDFGELAQKFKDSATKNLCIERMKALIVARLSAMVAANETRVDLREKFEQMIAEYNSGSMQIQRLFEELLNFSKGLDEEATRHVREQLSEEELVVFDLLTRPGPDLTSRERDAVKRVAREMLAKVRGVMAIDWQKTIQSRAAVRNAIEEALDEGLPEPYTPDVFVVKAGIVFQHVYEHYGMAA